MRDELINQVYVSAKIANNKHKQFKEAIVVFLCWSNFINNSVINFFLIFMSEFRDDLIADTKLFLKVNMKQ